MPSCSVATCHNTNRSTKGSGVMYHCFPKDPIYAAIWKSKCSRADYFDIKSGRICSQHFDASSYERDLKSELLGGTLKRRLSKTAVPNLKIPSMKKCVTPKKCLKQNKIQHRDQELYCQEVLQEMDISEESVSCESFPKLFVPCENVSEADDSESFPILIVPGEHVSEVDDSESFPKLIVPCENVSEADDSESFPKLIVPGENVSEVDDSESFPKLIVPCQSVSEVDDSESFPKLIVPCENVNEVDDSESFPKLIVSCDNVNEVDDSESVTLENNPESSAPFEILVETGKLQRLVKSVKSKNQKIVNLRKEKQKLKMQNFNLKREISETKRLNVSVKSLVKHEVRRVLGNIFTPAQINKLLSQKRTRWGYEDIVQALTIKNLSLKTYLHLKNKVGIPLPGLSTLRKMDQRIQSRCAIGGF